MNITHKLIYRFGHIWSISASVGLWFLLLGAIPDGLQNTAHAWIEKGFSATDSVVLAAGSPTTPAALCAERPQPPALTDCLRESL